MVTINSGTPEPDDRFQDTPRDKWPTLLNAKKSFLSRRLNYDCRCLIQFCEEAEVVYDELGFESPEAMIRQGYELEPSKVELAVAWLRANGTSEAVGLAEAVKAAKERPLAEHGEIGNGRNEYSRGNNVTSTRRGNDTDYTLRRLARDAPELLDKIQSGELSVNAAAIKAGIRKKPSPLDNLRAAWKRATDDQRAEFLREVTGDIGDD